MKPIKIPVEDLKKAIANSKKDTKRGINLVNQHTDIRNVKTFIPTYINEAEDENLLEPVNEGDIAESGERDPSGENTNPTWWIRINGKWVNILGTCESQSQIKFVYGTETKQGSTVCLAKADHQHGYPNSFKDENNEPYPEGTIVHVDGRSWVRCDDNFLCISNMFAPKHISTL